MKLIREYINEKFTDESDPIKDLGIGVRHKIEEWLNKMHIEKYTINDDLTIDVYSSVNLEHYAVPDIKKLPAYIKFNIVNGDFIVPANFSSMKGFPQLITGDFGCFWNDIKSLKYMPKSIGGSCHMGNFSKEEILKVCAVSPHCIYTRIK